MRRGLVLLLIVALLAVPLALALHDFSQVLMMELMRLIWMVRQQAESIPQFSVWGILLVGVLIAAVGSLFGWSWVSRDPDAGPIRIPGRVQEVSRWIRRAAQGRYFRWTLNRYVSNLAWEVLAYRERTTPCRLKERLRAGEMELPPGVLDYVGSSDLMSPPAPRSVWSVLRRRRPPAAPRHGARPTRVGLALQEVVEFLEDQMEVEHDLGSG